MSKNIIELVRAEPEGSPRRIELQRYRTACSNLDFLKLDAPFLAAWAKSSGQEQKDFKLLWYLAMLMETREYLELVNDPPSVPLTPKEIRGKLMWLNGFFMAAERRCGPFLESEFNRRISEMLKHWAYIVKTPYAEYWDDPEDVDTLYDDRDTMEYALSSVAWFQMDKPGRWSGVDTKGWLRHLHHHDDLLRERIKEAKQMKKHIPHPLAPDSFWWHK